MTNSKSNDSFPIDELIATFPDGNRRFVDTNVSLRLSWFPEMLSPEFSDELMSDHGVSAEERSFSSEFFEEVNAITDLLGKNNITSELAEWQKTGMAAVERMYQGLNRRAMALSIWNWYAIPLRLKGKTVYRIWAPRDVTGTPIIKALPLNDFLSLVAQETAKDKIELARYRGKIKRWQSATVVLGFIVIILVLFLWR